MKKINFLKLTLLLSIIILNQFNSFGQYPSLMDSPMFKNDKQNVFRDSLTNNLFNISFMDSLYKGGQSPFQIISNTEKGDSLIWLIKFIKKDHNSIKHKWLNKKFPLQDFVDINNTQIKTNELTGKILIINCWSVSCGPCIKEIPYLNMLKDSLNSNIYDYLAITFDDTESIIKLLKSNRLKEYLNIQNPSFNFRIIPNQQVLLDNILEVKSYPTTFIVDKEGFIKEIIEGVNLDNQRNPKTYSEIMDAIEKLE